MLLVARLVVVEALRLVLLEGCGIHGLHLLLVLLGEGAALGVVATLVMTIVEVITQTDPTELMLAFEAGHVHAA